MGMLAMAKLLYYDWLLQRLGVVTVQLLPSTWSQDTQAHF
jgi:hypothetical protein